MADYEDFDLEKQKLARKRRLAEKLLGSKPAEMQYQQFGGIRHVIAPGPYASIASAINRGAGYLDQQSADRDESDLNQREDEAIQQFSSSLSNTPEQRFEQLADARHIPGIRDIVEAEMGQQLGEPRVRAREAALLEQQQQAQQARQQAADARTASQQDRQDARAARREDRMDARAHRMHASDAQAPPSGFQWTLDPNTGQRVLAPVRGGPHDPANRVPTEGQANATLYSTRMSEADRIINEIGGDYSPARLNFTNSVSDLPAVGQAFGGAANAKLLTPNDQKVMQAQRDFVNAVLRRESGAAISPAEFNNAQIQYFAQPGDSPEVIAQKGRNRQTAIEQIRAAGSPGLARTREKQNAPKPTVVRSGTDKRTGKRVYQMSDGSVRVKPGQQ